MKRILLCILLNGTLFPTAFSQRKIVNTKIYKIKGAEWYEIDKNTDQEFKVDTTVVTVKFKSILSKERFEESHATLKVIHYNKIGYGLIKKPKTIDIFTFVNKLKKDSNITVIQSKIKK